MQNALTNSEPANVDVAAAVQGRMLVPLTAAAPRITRGVSRPAAFLAHLIAVKEQHPQTRERRRAEPAEAIRAYLGTIAANL